MTIPPTTENRIRRHFPKPTLVISECLEFEPCRYDGGRVHFDLVEALEPYAEYRPVCPDVQIGLGVPRDTIRLVASGDRNLLVQPATGRDLTDDMEGYSSRFLDSLDVVDGFILKSRSPSCGTGSVKVYDGAESGTAVRSARALSDTPQYTVRFGSAYMLDQALFAPFPEALASPADSGKGRAAGR